MLAIIASALGLDELIGMLVEAVLTPVGTALGGLVGMGIDGEAMANPLTMTVVDTT